ncbi:hypothetical protein ANCDUO_19736 [Ancylostoma duodenale]|uniref:Uncharacterized protein n=1 Tax=Ancylostoma duodenale TaxID=51022 RepID=A0A0C2CK67_9BILA|nr:hypothetical protein ANCDUO_19736 [Ancylostoma duodenale]
MKDQADARLLHEQHNSSRKPENSKMKLATSVWPTTAATVVALIACLLFSIFFQRALSGFSRQVCGIGVTL